MDDDDRTVPPMWFVYCTFIIAPVLVPFESGDASCRCNSASKSLSPKIPLSWLVAMIGSLFPFTG
jgi:hypothetical protein